MNVELDDRVLDAATRALLKVTSDPELGAHPVEVLHALIGVAALMGRGAINLDPGAADWVLPAVARLRAYLAGGEPVLAASKQDPRWH
jgi:hypothetical protein